MSASALALGNPKHQIRGGIKEVEDPNSEMDKTTSRRDREVAAKYLQELYGKKVINKNNSSTNSGAKESL